MPIIDLAPLDSEGLRRDRPSHETKWGKLINVAFKNGSLVPRPGFKEVEGFTNQLVDSGTEASIVEIAPANGLIEIFNPGSATGRDGLSYISETIRPDGSAEITAGNPWSPLSNWHLSVDEVVPDGSVVSTTTPGAQIYFTFANPSGTYPCVLTVQVKLRVRVSTGKYAALTGKIYQRDSSSGTLYDVDGGFTLYANASGFGAETPLVFFSDYVFPINVPFAGAQGDTFWSATDLNNLQIAVEYTNESIKHYFVPASIESNTGWVDASDGGAAVFSDIVLVAPQTTIDAVDPQSGDIDNLFPPVLWQSADAQNGLVSSGSANDALEIAFEEWDASFGSFAGIGSVTVGFYVSNTGYVPVEYQILYNDSTQVDSGVLEPNAGTKESEIRVDMATIPTGGAWTKAAVEASTWTFKITNAAVATIRAAALFVEDISTLSGGLTNTGIEIDTLSVEIVGSNGEEDPAKLICSNKSFLQVDYDTTPGEPDIVDVTNSVASTGAPSVYPFDWAILYGQCYVVNGINPTKRYPNATDVFESLSTNNADGATPITGRTVESFADRIIYGWVRDNTTVTPERVAYSRIFNGGTHNHDTAGDFDIVDTMGGVVKLKTLNESLCFCGKETGIYALRRTGSSRAPIIVDPIDYETRCVAQHTALRVIVNGKPVVMFLGWNQATSFNVFAFDGTTVTPVGNAITRFLEDGLNDKMIRFAIAGVDSITNTYILFLASAFETERSLAFAMNLNSGAWTKWELPYGIYSTAQWVLSRNTIVCGGGIPTLVVGSEKNLPLQAHYLPYDSLTPPQDPGAATFFGGFTSGTEHPTDDDKTGAQVNLFTSTIETGDIQMVTPENEVQITSARLHLDYRDYGPVRLAVGHSVDGGYTWSDDTIVFIGSLEKTTARKHSFLDLENLVHDRSVRFRIRVLPEDSTEGLPFYWEIQRIYINYTAGAIDGA